MLLGEAKVQCFLQHFPPSMSHRFSECFPLSFIHVSRGDRFCDYHYAQLLCLLVAAVWLVDEFPILWHSESTGGWECISGGE